MAVLLVMQFSNNGCGTFSFIGLCFSLHFVLASHRWLHSVCVLAMSLPSEAPPRITALHSLIV